MIERGESPEPGASGAARAWSGGRPWTGPAVGAGAQGRPAPIGEPVGEPMEELAGVGVDLAVALGWAAGQIGGPRLAAVGEAARGHLVDVAVAAERVIAWAGGVQAAAVAALHGQFLAEHDLDAADLAGPAADLAGAAAEPAGTAKPVHPTRGGLAEELAAFEHAGRATAGCVSLALGCSGWAADRLLAFALALADLPDLARALADGRIDLAQGRSITQATAALVPGRRERLVAALVADPDTVDRDDPPGPGLVRELADGLVPVWAVPPHRLRPIIAREVAAADPQALADAEASAVRGRRVEFCGSSPDRPAMVVLHGPEHHLAAAFDALDAGARAARRAGAPQSLDQLRYDAAITALTGAADAAGRTRGAPAPIAVRVDVVVAADTLLGLDDLPGVLRTPAGDAPISPDQARRLAYCTAAEADTTWRRILTDPATGTATDCSSGYRPARSIADYVRVRDGHTSRHPSSGARTVELDHVRPYDHAHPETGGPTTAANLASLGKREHQTKTDRLITVSGNANHTLTIHTRAGHTYPTRPHQYLSAGRPARSSGDPPY